MMRLQKILKTSLQDLLKTSWRCIEDIFTAVLKTFWRRVEDFLKTFLQDVLNTYSKCLEDILARRLEDVLKTYGQDEYIGLDQDVLKTSSEDDWLSSNIFVSINTSSEDENGRRLPDVFIKTNVCWVSSRTPRSMIKQRELMRQIWRVLNPT